MCQNYKEKIIYYNKIPKFYYDDYKFEENKKYLIFFRGCFSPTTRGHFSLVEKYSHLPNVKYYISQIGSEARHGVPYYLNRKIWNIYINKLLPKDRIILKKAYGIYDVLDEIENIDVVIYLRGNEKDSGDLRYEEKERLYKYRNIISKLKRKGIRTDFLIIDRPEAHVLSATKFIEALKNNSSYNKLRFYVPKNLPENDFRYIIKKQKLKI